MRVFPELVLSVDYIRGLFRASVWIREMQRQADQADHREG